MARYIDIDELAEMIRARSDMLVEGKQAFYYIANWLDKLPTADVEEVKHGIWNRGTEPSGSVYAHCSACNRKMNYSCYGYARCSLCGAKMDGKDIKVPTTDGGKEE